MSRNQYRITKLACPTAIGQNRNFINAAVRNIYNDSSKLISKCSNSLPVRMVSSLHSYVDDGFKSAQRAKNAVKTSVAVMRHHSSNCETPKMVGAKKTRNQIQGISQISTKSLHNLPRCNVGWPVSYKIYGKTGILSSSSSFTSARYRGTLGSVTPRNKSNESLDSDIIGRVPIPYKRRESRVVFSSEIHKARANLFVREICSSIRDELMPFNSETKKLLAVPGSKSPDSTYVSSKPQTNLNPIESWQHYAKESLDEKNKLLEHSKTLLKRFGTNTAVKENYYEADKNDISMTPKLKLQGKDLNDMYMATSKESDGIYEHRRNLRTTLSSLSNGYWDKRPIQYTNRYKSETSLGDESNQPGVRNANNKTNRLDEMHYTLQSKSDLSALQQVSNTKDARNDAFTELRHGIKQYHVNMHNSESSRYNAERTQSKFSDYKLSEVSRKRAQALKRAMALAVQQQDYKSSSESDVNAFTPTQNEDRKNLQMQSFGNVYRQTVDDVSHPAIVSKDLQKIVVAEKASDIYNASATSKKATSSTSVQASTMPKQPSVAPSQRNLHQDNVATGHGIEFNKQSGLYRLNQSKLLRPQESRINHSYHIQNFKVRAQSNN